MQNVAFLHNSYHDTILVSLYKFITMWGVCTQEARYFLDYMLLELSFNIKYDFIVSKE